MFSILEQFENTPIFNIFNIVFFSNTAFFYIIQFYIIFLLFYIPNNSLITKYYIPYFIKFLYMFNIDLLNTNGLLKQYNFLITFFFFLSQVIFLANISGMFTYSLTITSQIVVTFFFSSIIFFNTLIVGITEHKLKFTNVVLPSQVPLYLAPPLIIIEIISYSARLFSLAIRLFANTLAGHALLKILFSMVFSVLIYQIGGIIGFLNIFIICVCLFIFLLEIFVSILQSYVFVMLSVSYYKDVIYLH